MAAQKSPLLGYNHNLKYEGRVYHVQTEDSGLGNPHIFTHLFHDGTILNTLKQEYKDIVGDPDWENKLRSRMQEQHKDMMKGLVKGSFNDKIVQFFGTLTAEVAEEMPMATLPPPPKRQRASSGQAPAARQPPAQQPPPQQPPAQQPPAQQPPAQQPPQRPAADSSGVVVAMPMVIVGQQGQAPAAPTAPAPPVQTGPQELPPEDAPTFSNVPQESKTVPDSIFGSELISEKSLDEVILAYLSEDMTDE